MDTFVVAEFELSGHTVDPLTTKSALKGAHFKAADDLQQRV